MTENSNSKVKKLMEKVRNKVNKAAVAGALGATVLTGTGCHGSDNKQTDSENEKIENVQNEYVSEKTADEYRDEFYRNDTVVVGSEFSSPKFVSTNDSVLNGRSVVGMEYDKLKALAPNDSVLGSMEISDIRRIGSEKDGYKNDTVTHKVEKKLSYEEAAEAGVLKKRWVKVRE